MQRITEFPYEVRVIEDWIPLSDGTRLWMRAWRPVTDEAVPGILEYLPYRAGDWSAPRDHERHPYYAGHGYASIRVDIRGHGSSDGVPGDEYDAQEQADGLEVIDWIAAQDWCTGRVGMVGISWGGFSALQLASHRPEPLRAIVTVCSSDDRYDNDVHYTGGSMLAVDQLAWAATMLAFESRPPDPRVVGGAWRRMWLHRLEQMEPYLDGWLGHQLRDGYWEHGSVCEDYSSIDAAVLAVGGWYDPYRDTVLRLVEHLSALGRDVRGLIGPWAHQYPDRALPPGPHIDFLGETLRWWDRWLREEDNDVMDEPLLRTWITDPIPPSSAHEQVPGRWVAETAWPSPDIVPTAYRFADAHLSPLAATLGGHEGARRSVMIDSPQDTGQSAGRYFPYGNAGDLPTDQRADDGRSVTFDVALAEDLEILGRPTATLRVSSPTERGQLYVRLCDVAPDGSSTLITRGGLNLTARAGRDRAVPFPVGEWADVEVALTGIGYRFPAGHVLRVAVSTAYWPWIWPQPVAGGLHLDVDRSEIVLPVRPVPAAGTRRAALDASIRFGPPVQAGGLEVRYPQAGRAGAQRPERLVSTDVVARTTTLQVDPAYGGTRIYPDGLHYDEETVERYRIRWDDPTTARAEAVWRIALARPEMDWRCSLEATTRITCDRESFRTESTVECHDGEQMIFRKVWRGAIARVAS